MTVRDYLGQAFGLDQRINSNKELETNLSDIVRGRDATGNKRVWKGLRFGDCID